MRASANSATSERLRLSSCGRSLVTVATRHRSRGIVTGLTPATARYRASRFATILRDPGTRGDTRYGRSVWSGSLPPPSVVGRRPSELRQTRSELARRRRVCLRACPRARERVHARGRSRDGDERVRREAADNRGLLRHGVVYATLIVAPRRAATTHWWQATDRGRINSAGLAALRRIRHCYRLIKSSRRAPVAPRCVRWVGNSLSPRRRL